MFYDDPMLYGATFPIKDFAYRGPHFAQHFAPTATPWQTRQPYLPEAYGYGGYGFTDLPRPPFPLSQQRLPFDPLMQYAHPQWRGFQGFQGYQDVQPLPITQFQPYTPHMATPYFGYDPVPVAMPFRGWQRPWIG